jgi:hypothetical protein
VCHSSQSEDTQEAQAYFSTVDCVEAKLASTEAETESCVNQKANLVQEATQIAEDCLNRAMATEVAKEDENQKLQSAECAGEVSPPEAAGVTTAAPEMKPLQDSSDAFAEFSSRGGSEDVTPEIAPPIDPPKVP